MLCLHTSRDVEKLQKLQNRCLRLCFDVINPRDTSVECLHRLARVDTLEIRLDIQLLNIMFHLKSNKKIHKVMERNTRSAERYVFDMEIVHMDVYAKSPYIKLKVYVSAIHFLMTFRHLVMDTNSKLL